MDIIIDRNYNLKYNAKRKFIFWWIQINEFEFDSSEALIKWIRKYYAPEYFKSRSSTYLKKAEIFKFYPERRDQIDIDFN